MNYNNNELVKKYAKKIMGFAVNKTQNIERAEDLAQEIFLQLFRAILKEDDIENMDAFVTTVCKYTWSNFLQKNKRHWDYSDIDNLFELQADINVESIVEQKIMAEKMRRELSYLCRVHREIIILFYYENKSTRQIAEKMRIKEGTIRWHLSKCRDELKERITMKQDYLDTIPVRLWVGMDGYFGTDSNIGGLKDNLLVQNIIWACYGKPLEMEKIARKLNVALAYIEGHIEKLTDMDFLKKIHGGYQTNFYIQTTEDQIYKTTYAWEHIGTLAEKILDCAQNRIQHILDINFMGSQTKPASDILWMVINQAAQELTYGMVEDFMEKEHIICPIRSDGGEYWVITGIYTEQPPSMPPELKEFCDMSQCRGYRLEESDFAEMIVSENYLNKNRVPSFRNLSSKQINDIIKTVQIINTQKEPDPFEKVMIAELIEEGYVKMSNGYPQLQIMYFTKEQYARYTTIIEEIKAELKEPYWKEYFNTCLHDNLSRIPEFLPDKMRKYYALNRLIAFDILGWLIYHKKLELPDETDSKSSCVIVYEKK